jgi:hypothetical protein
MSLRRYAQEGRLRRHQASRNEIVALFAAVERDLSDAAVIALSPDRRFAVAYSAALTLCTIILHAEGFRSVGPGHHEVTVLSLPHILGPSAHDRSRYLNACRIRRNRIDYDGIGFATHTEANELIADVELFGSEIVDWLSATHPHLAP